MWISVVLLFCINFEVKAGTILRSFHDQADGRSYKAIVMNVTKDGLEDKYHCSATYIPKISKNDNIVMRVYSPVEIKEHKCGSVINSNNEPSYVNHMFKVKENSSVVKIINDTYIYDYDLKGVSVIKKENHCFFSVYNNYHKCKPPTYYGCDYHNSFNVSYGAQCKLSLNYSDPDIIHIKVNGQAVNISQAEEDYDAIGTYYYYDGEHANINCSKKAGFVENVAFNLYANFDITKYTNHSKGIEMNYSFLDNVILSAEHDGKYIDCSGYIPWNIIQTFYIRLKLQMDNSKQKPNGSPSNGIFPNDHQETTTDSTSPGSGSNLNKKSTDFIVIASVAPIVIVFIGMGIMIFVCRKKTIPIKPNPTQNAYGTLAEDTSANAHLDNNYARPSDCLEYSYSLPHNPLTVQELYATPIPKHQRQDKPYVTMGAVPLAKNLKKMDITSTDILKARNKIAGKREPYTELTNENPYVEMSNDSESPYAELSNKTDTSYTQIKFSNGKKINLPKKENPYAVIVYPEVKSNDADRYCNTFDNERYANAHSSKSDYAEPAYCGVNVVRKD